jgi:hypothetical protein
MYLCIIWCKRRNFIHVNIDGFSIDLSQLNITNTQKKREKLDNVYINGQSYIGMLFRIINDEPAWHRPLWLQMVAPWAGIDPPLLLSSAHITHCKGKTKEVRLSYQCTVSLFNRNSYKYCKYNSIRCLKLPSGQIGCMRVVRYHWMDRPCKGHQPL